MFLSFKVVQFKLFHLSIFDNNFFHFFMRISMKLKRIKYIERNLLEKSVKRPFCCTVSILQVYFTYLCYITCWTREYHFIENLKLLLKEKQIMK